MKGTFVVLFVVATLTGCAGARSAKAAAMSWPECALAQTLSWLEHGTSAWPVVAALPAGVEIHVVSLGAFPPEAIHDALYRTLHLVPSSNAVYVEQTGGIAGMHQLYGPMSLDGHCNGAP